MSVQAFSVIETCYFRPSFCFTWAVTSVERVVHKKVAHPELKLW